MLRLGAIAVLGLLGGLGMATADGPLAIPAGDLGLLQGYWKPLSVLYEGKPQMTVDEMKKITAVFDHAEYHLYYKDSAKDPTGVPLKLALMNVSLDEKVSPKAIAFEFAAGALKGQKRHGIYEVAGNELKMCYCPVEKPRPDRFAAPEKSGYFLEVWAKQPTK